MAFLRRLSGLRSVHRSLTIKAAPSSTSPAVADLRKEYSRQGLVEDEFIIEQGPFNLFQAWLNEAIAAKVIEPNAMCLSTCDEHNRPSGRYVLLKGFDKNGFVWYTNYQSRKGNQLSVNPFASLTFWWGDLERSVRIEGTVEKVSDTESDAYFQSRPRSSQIGAWSSHQSQAINSRRELEEQEKAIVKKFEGVNPVPRPPHWGGFRLIPNRIEFWKGRESRLHDRLVFEREDATSAWKLTRLQP
jgi:pyridoxamine 5'-phosphate oxidase